MRKSDHRRDANAAPHEIGFGGVFHEIKVVDRFGNKDTPPFIKDAVHHQRATAPFVFSQYTDLILGGVRRIARHRILTQEIRGDDHIEMPASGPVGQS